MAIMYQVVIDTNVLVAALRFEAWLFVPAPGSGGRSTRAGEFVGCAGAREQRERDDARCMVK